MDDAAALGGKVWGFFDMRVLMLKLRLLLFRLQGRL